MYGMNFGSQCSLQIWTAFGEYYNRHDILPTLCWCSGLKAVLHSFLGPWYPKVRLYHVSLLRPQGYFLVAVPQMARGFSFSVGFLGTWASCFRKLVCARNPIYLKLHCCWSIRHDRPDDARQHSSIPIDVPRFSCRLASDRMEMIRL